MRFIAHLLIQLPRHPSLLYSCHDLVTTLYRIMKEYPCMYKAFIVCIWYLAALRAELLIFEVWHCYGTQDFDGVWRCWTLSGLHQSLFVHLSSHSNEAVPRTCHAIYLHPLIHS
jgi:hypothetical protein